MDMIRAEHLSLAHRDGQNRLPVLEDISIHIGQGEWVALTGPNGCGKSTLVRLFNGLNIPDSGSLSVTGLDMRSPVNRSAVKQRIQLVFQNPEGQTVGATPYEDVSFGLENRGIEPGEMKRRIGEVLAQVGLAHKAGTPVSSLSGGERQRLAAACCLALEPEMIVFDEVTSMLDPAGRSDMLMLARRLWLAGMGVLWVTQRMDELAASPRIAVMQEGKLLYDGDPRTLFYSSSLPEQLGWEPPPAVRIGRLLQAQGWPVHLLPLSERDLEEIL